MDTYNILARGPIKSFQRGYSSAAGNVTINEVNMVKTIILVNSRTANSSYYPVAYFQNKDSIYVYYTCDWQLIEFY